MMMIYKIFSNLMKEFMKIYNKMMVYKNSKNNKIKNKIQNSKNNKNNKIKNYIQNSKNIKNNKNNKYKTFKILKNNK